MPWINEEMCIGCDVCIEHCPVEAIEKVNNVAAINEQLCIRCGVCHDVCTVGAVRHDSERVPEEIAANLAWTSSLLAHFDTIEEKHQLLERMQRYFIKNKKVAEQTVEQIKSLDKKLLEV